MKCNGLYNSLKIIWFERMKDYNSRIPNNTDSQVNIHTLAMTK